jgi:integrase
LAKAALTAAAVERMKPPKAGQIDVFDRGYPGLALRVSYGGRKAFVFMYRYGAKVRRLSLGTYPAVSLAEAREVWKEARRDLERGRDPAAATRHREKPSTEFAQVADEWVKRDQAGNRTQREARRIVEVYVKPKWAGLQVRDISRRDVLDLVDGIADRGTPVMARRVHSRLQRLFNWCVERGILTMSPMHGLPKPASETSRDRVLNDDELVAVWRAAHEMGWPFGVAVQLLILTGARREEIGALRWAEIGDRQICLKGERTKNGEPHDIPLSTAALAVLKNAKHIAGSEFVFTTTGKTPVSGWSRVKQVIDKVAPIEPWRLHDLRRTLATGLKKLGVGIQVVEAVLGHISGSRAGVVGIYQRHDYAAEKRSALEAWGAHVTSLIEDGPQGKVLAYGRR